MINNNFLGQPSLLVNLLLYCDTFDNITIGDTAGHLSKDRQRVRIPLNQFLATLKLLPIFHFETSSIDDLVALFFTPLLILNHQHSIPIHHNHGTLTAVDCTHVLITHDPTIFCLEGTLFYLPASGATDVKGPHSELRTRFAD